MTTAVPAVGGPTPLRWRDAPLILMYHSVADVPDPADDPHLLSVSPRRFAAHMTWLYGRGLRGVGVDELLAAIRGSRARGLVGITFDDGYADLVDGALPALRTFGFGATVFVVAGRLGMTNDWDDTPPRPLLDAAGIRRLADAGIEIGSHSTTHAALTGAGHRVLEAEVADSRNRLAEVVGAPVTGFAYPYGVMDGAARAAVRGAGYTYACAVSTPCRRLDLTALPRIYAGNSDRGRHLAAKRLLYRAYIPLRGGLR